VDVAGAKSLSERIEAYNRGGRPAGQAADAAVTSPAPPSLRLERRATHRGRPRTVEAHPLGGVARQIPTVALSTGLAILASMVTSISILALHHDAAPSTVVVTAPAPPSVAPPAGSNVGSLHGIASYNPFGTGPEHPEDVAKATDRSLSSYWPTETYVAHGFWKPGTGLVLAITGTTKPARLEIVTDTPGFRAQIRVGRSATGPFARDSAWKTIGRRTIFALSGRSGRFLLVWLRIPAVGGSAHLNEVRLLP
jgi:hypothetical protein